MFIAHLPAGYLAGKAIFRGQKARMAIPAAMLGSIFPDFDLSYFYVIDGRGTNHHYYWFHLPFFWFCVLAPAWLVIRLRNPRWAWAVAGFGVGILTHMMLDSVASAIFWLAPFSWQPFNLIPVQPRYDWWVWNYVLHPSFWAEIVLITTATGVWGAGRWKCRGGILFGRET